MQEIASHTINNKDDKCYANFEIQLFKLEPEYLTRYIYKSTVSYIT